MKSTRRSSCSYRRRPTVSIVQKSSSSHCLYPAVITWMMGTVCSVLAFVVVQQSLTTKPSFGSSSRHRYMPSSALNSGDATDLKSILTSSDYDLGVGEVNRGKLVKTTIQKVAKKVTEEAPSASVVTDEAAAAVAPTMTEDTMSGVTTMAPPPLPEQSITATIKAVEMTEPKEIMPDLSDSISITPDVSDKLSQPFVGLNNFLKMTQDSLKTSQVKPSGGGTSANSPFDVQEVTSTSPLPAGKALPLTEFVKAKLTGTATSSGGSNDAALTESKEKFGLLLKNIDEFFGGGVSATFGGMAQKLPGSASTGSTSTTLVPQFWNEASKSATAALDQLPEGSAPWIAVGMGVILLAAGTKDEGKAEVAQTSSYLKESSAKLGDLTDDLTMLKTRLQLMEKSGVSLTGELRAASEKLLEKELEISKERLKALDTASKLKRQIEELELKLQQNDGKVQTLDKELMKTKNECETLTAELLKAKETQPVVEAVLAPPVPKKRSIKKEGEDLKKAAKKEIAVKEASKEELPSASSTDTTSPSPKAKSKSKTKATKSKSTPTKKASEPEPATTTVSSSSSSSNLSSPVGTDDWSTLSKSTLTRKTVKELQDYLDGKGLTTIDSEGRPLKKALLVDAVLSS